MLKNVKMQSITIVGILTFISMITTISESLKARSLYFSQHLSFYVEFEISCSVELSMKKVLQPQGLATI